MKLEQKAETVLRKYALDVMDQEIDKKNLKESNSLMNMTLNISIFILPILTLFIDDLTLFAATLRQWKNNAWYIYTRRFPLT